MKRRRFEVHRVSLTAINKLDYSFGNTAAPTKPVNNRSSVRPSSENRPARQRRNCDSPFHSTPRSALSRQNNPAASTMNDLLEDIAQLKREQKQNTKKVQSDQAVEVCRNHDLLRCIGADTSEICSFTLLDSCDPDYVNIQGKMQKNLPMYRKSFQLISVERIENPYLKAMYELKKAESKRKYGNMVVDRRLFHGSSEDKIASICRANFDRRLCGSARGTKYGQGISFSPKFMYSQCFCSKTDEVKVMLRCKVLFARAHLGDEHTEVPMEGYDATQRDNGSVVVKYDDDVFYPELRIRFVVHKLPKRSKKCACAALL